MFDVPADRETGASSDTEKNSFPEDNLNLGGDRGANKPPMTNPVDDTTTAPTDKDPGTPADDKTFLNGGNANPNEASNGRDTVLARTSSLNEVIAPKRLASRSLPSTHRTVSNSKVAGKAEGQKSNSQQPLRWISAPLPTGHVSL